MHAKIFPIIGIRAWERRAKRKIIFPIIILPHEKHLSQGVQYLALRLVLMDAPLMRPVCFEWGKGWGAEANLVNGGNLGTRTLGSGIQDSLKIIPKGGGITIAVGNSNPFVFILDTLVCVSVCVK